MLENVQIQNEKFYPRRFDVIVSLIMFSLSIISLLEEYIQLTLLSASWSSLLVLEICPRFSNKCASFLGLRIVVLPFITNEHVRCETLVRINRLITIGTYKGCAKCSVVIYLRKVTQL